MRRPAIIARQPVDVVFAFGQSQIAGARNALTDLPAGYYTTDNSAFIWDRNASGKIVTLVPGPLEQQPNPALIDVTFTNTVGPAGEFVKHYRIDNPDRKLLFFNHQMGGGRFSDLGSNGRTVNYKTNLSDGAFISLLRSWAECKAAMEAKGWTPNFILAWSDLGYGSALDATEAANFQTDMQDLIAHLRAIIFGDTKLVLARVSSQSTGLANAAAVRSAQQAIVVADPTRCELMNTDGFPTVAVDSLHFTAASHLIQGEQLYYHAAGLWYPQKEWAFSGGNACVNEWRPGDFRNTAGATAFTLTGGNLQTMWNCTGGAIRPTQGTDTKRPVIGVNTLPNGFTVRYAAGDGTDDALVATAASLLTQASYAFFAAFKGAALANGTLMGEGGTGANPFANFARNDASGNAQYLYRDDAGTVTGPTTLNASAYNSQWNAFGLWETGGTINTELNGAAGTPLSYTRGTITVNRKSFWALNYTGGGAEIHYGNAQLGILWEPTSVPDTAYKANARAFMQRRWGTV